MRKLNLIKKSEVLLKIDNLKLIEDDLVKNLEVQTKL